MKITLGWDSAGQIDPMWCRVMLDCLNSIALQIDPMWCRVMLDCLNSIALQIDPMFYGQLFL